MPIFLALLAGAVFLGSSNKTYIVNNVEKKLDEIPKTGKCNACPEENCPMRMEYGWYACDFCYEMYKKYDPRNVVTFNSRPYDNY